MTAEVTTPDQDQDSDYDGAWKEALRRFLRQFLAKDLPAARADAGGAGRSAARLGAG